MQSLEVIEENTFSLNFLLTDSNKENDDYDENLDEYDINEDDYYDDGIARSKQDEDFDEDFEEDFDEDSDDPETAFSADVDSYLPSYIEDSLPETEDYDSIDD
jgi:hypothetical protein